MVQPALTKTLLTGVIAGVVGGGAILYGQQGVQLLQNQNQKVSTTATSTKTIAKNATATSAYNKVSDAVVSVLNFTKSSQGSYQESSEGSGVIYKKTDGSAFIVTNNHVITGAAKIQVMLHSGKKVTATLVGKDAMTDLAVLKIDGTDVTTTAQFGDSSKITVGENVLAIGSPLGSEYASSVTQGIISAKKRLVEATSENGQNYGGSTVIQTDAAINPGNSGGPLINFAGQVIGINSMKLSTSSSGTSVEGMGFAIPSDQVVDIVNKLVKDGKVTRPAIGISLINLSEVTASEQKSTLKIPDSVTGGVVVMSLTNNGPADKAGLKKYDVIVGINGKKVSSQADLREELYKHSLGDTITLTYYHQDTKQTVKVKLTQKLAS
ncbi:trypsin-like peptidase domain-containing protein [Leuconostoc mesenteroides]|uniref:Trypsin-like serine protease with PDZ domain n=1 Tax=Leuconostoc mesenteroides subsp. mesenteroides (strain ATCC 8293 / DSM 20343 / BCRC 11652 / CCM 1803 / JCM 6124 / NCDO 523 / NBRC 100496 / NCIMB 8023 / NCTC 12954 / NRRL B-1118 / 37Y) TaxID=203120 RepID=Q03UV5_LEUMM|nr:trypsin-like peptidase domain-containing protein [Leuconostoc mesenteroides]ABJ63017.1 Trypsin-like serine protease with PDZ domain [Leuconostoc mesenteroides subsp. mesenteroides ATCC 8293]MCT3042692.1 PDZ domain-containing protein [Leuconostoc mesenteroides]MCU4664016.1 trypsin-like peptidase domain-containing protein [Leuconostoc mesenteroides]MDG9746813.1 trypsin-like peptidase domain-containing protein [Leuconostoc mesenteroides]QQB30235.1 trypsin-like peptidase domain-containing prote